jgi:hypothetical protein
VKEELPKGWNAGAEPDGTVRITLPRRESRSQGLLLAGSGLICGLMGALMIASLSRRVPTTVGGGSWHAWRLTFLPALGVLLIAEGLWLAFGREEWRVGTDRLEVTQGLFGLRRVRRFQAASLRLIAAATGGASTRTQRRLLRAVRAGRRALNRKTSWQSLAVVTNRSHHRLASASSHGLSAEQLRSLGTWLAEQTGWPLLLPGARKG